MLDELGRAEIRWGWTGMDWADGLAGPNRAATVKPKKKSTRLALNGEPRAKREDSGDRASGSKLRAGRELRVSGERSSCGSRA
ncbi:hypothetical protein CRG98_005861 [Punica granatum]|uniref:Uncharacterized protein n=1 Tax=Punica granatum TaxID=22663 RepID=A0A2I0KZ59_PUNGR|nr:hypothetical protein CRG98_005861 [Punica granatum]